MATTHRSPAGSGLYELKPVSGLTLTAGLRLDDHSSFGASTTGRAASSMGPASDALVLRGSWGQGFKAPTIFQLTQSFGALPANGDLQPETSEAFDLGVDWAVSQHLQLGPGLILIATRKMKLPSRQIFAMRTSPRQPLRELN